MKISVAGNILCLAEKKIYCDFPYFAVLTTTKIITKEILSLVQIPNSLGSVSCIEYSHTIYSWYKLKVQYANLKTCIKVIPSVILICLQVGED